MLFKVVTDWCRKRRMKKECVLKRFSYHVDMARTLQSRLSRNTEGFIQAQARGVSSFSSEYRALCAEQDAIEADLKTWEGYQP